MNAQRGFVLSGLTPWLAGAAAVVAALLLGWVATEKISHAATHKKLTACEGSVASLQGAVDRQNAAVAALEAGCRAEALEDDNAALRALAQPVAALDGSGPARLNEWLIARLEAR